MKAMQLKFHEGFESMQGVSMQLAAYTKTETEIKINLLNDIVWLVSALRCTLFNQQACVSDDGSQSSWSPTSEYDSVADGSKHCTS